MKKYLLLTLAGTVLVMSSAFANEVPMASNIEGTTVEQSLEKKHKRPSKEEMRAHFAKRLNLTEEQQKQADQIHEKSRAKMQEIKKQMQDLRKQADTIREGNKKEFESILTEEQKKTLETMKKEHKGPKKHRQVPMLKKAPLSIPAH